MKKAKTKQQVPAKEEGHVSVTIRMPARLERALRDRADARLVSRNDIAREIIINHLRAEGALA